MAVSKDAATTLILEMAAKGKSLDILMQTRSAKKPKAYGIGYSGGRRGSFSPDAVVQYDGSSDFFAIEGELTKANTPELIYKWILFSMEAKKLKGKLFIVVAKNKEHEYSHLIGWKQIDATLLAI